MFKSFKNILSLIIVIKLITVEISAFILPVAQNQDSSRAVVPIIVDHNRTIIEVEVKKQDGTWRKARLWIDSGAPEFFISKTLAEDLGYDMPGKEKLLPNVSSLPLNNVPEIKTGKKKLDFNGIKGKILIQPFWLLNSIHIDGNFPATLLQKYHIVIDYPLKKMIIADAGKIKPSGEAYPVKINRSTGIIQTNIKINNEQLSMAIDIGASYSFISSDVFNNLKFDKSKWKRFKGTAGYANMWGWWPGNSNKFYVNLIPEIIIGKMKLNELGIVEVTEFLPNGPSIGEWYSQKTEEPVAGFLGGNFGKNFRIEIDYKNGMLYLTKRKNIKNTDMKIVGVSLQLLETGFYRVAGLVEKDGQLLNKKIKEGDVITSIDGKSVQNLTMGKVNNLLTGKAGEIKKIELIRDDKTISINEKVYDLFK